MSYEISKDCNKHRDWLIQEASFRMLVEELERPDLVVFDRIASLVDIGISSKTIIIVEKDNKPVGVIGSLLIDNLFNPSIKTLSEIFWYVLPEHRKSRVPLMLINAFDSLAMEIADEATFSLFLGTNNVKIESMEKRGFKLNEFAFRKEY